jgi:hypothetical protein
MDYVFNLTVPPATPPDIPERMEAPIPPGVVVGVRVLFPSGCAGLVGARILVDEVQVWPSTLGMWYIGDGVHIAFTENYILKETLNLVAVEVYNEDDYYPHTVSVALTHQPFAAGEVKPVRVYAEEETWPGSPTT